jgi:hypothetical protein
MLYLSMYQLRWTTSRWLQESRWRPAESCQMTCRVRWWKIVWILPCSLHGRRHHVELEAEAGRRRKEKQRRRESSCTCAVVLCCYVPCMRAWVARPCMLSYRRRRHEDAFRSSVDDTAANIFVRHGRRHKYVMAHAMHEICNLVGKHMQRIITANHVRPGRAGQCNVKRVVMFYVCVPSSN